MGCRGFRQYRDRWNALLKLRLRDESGQSIVLISVVILSFLMFFSFAINTGLLINAKISVQAAADAAAYAGAAVQGRQLNAISFLNYDMREQYKKFIFRYTFVGSMGSADFPKINTTNPNGPSPDYDFEKLDYGNGPMIYHGLKVPVVCIPLTTAGTPNDNCRFVNLRNTANVLAGTNTSGLNPIQDASIQAMLNIANLQNNLCAGQGEINFVTLITWLFRANLDDSALIADLQTLSVQLKSIPNPAQANQLVDVIKPLLSGLGLYPRNILSLMRAHTLEGYINQKPELAITKESVDGWLSAPDADARERTIQAFRSALSNLNTDIFDENLLQMDELQSPHMLTLNNATTSFNVYLQHSDPNAPVTNASATSPLICQSRIDPFPAIDAPVGLTTSLMKVNYGVHLKAFIKPHGLMYLPNSDALELDAYAGAKPFGGRIGPAQPQPYATPIQPDPVNGQVVNDCQGQAQCNVPYLFLLGNQVGSYNTNYLTALKNTATEGGTAFTFKGILAAQAQAMAPNPTEVGHYNILPPRNTNAKSLPYDYIPYSVDPLVYRFYAPVFPNNGADPTGVINGFLDQIFPKTQIGLGANAFGIDTNTMKQGLLQNILTYIKTALNVGGTASENGETLTFAAVPYPMASNLAPGAGGYWLTNPAQTSTSWGPGTSGAVSPRFGYSVKFVALRDLQQDGLGSGDDELSTVNH